MGAGYSYTGPSLWQECPSVCVCLLFMCQHWLNHLYCTSTNIHVSSKYIEMCWKLSQDIQCSYAPWNRMLLTEIHLTYNVLLYVCFLLICVLWLCIYVVHVLWCMLMACRCYMNVSLWSYQYILIVPLLRNLPVRDNPYFKYSNHLLCHTTSVWEDTCIYK